jgi:hypothetical protein
MSRQILWIDELAVFRPFVAKTGDAKNFLIDGDDYFLVPEAGHLSKAEGELRPDVVLVHATKVASFAQELKIALGLGLAQHSIFFYSTQGNPSRSNLASAGLGKASFIRVAIGQLKSSDFDELLAYGTGASNDLPACCQAERRDFWIAAAVAVRCALLLPTEPTKDWIFGALGVTDLASFNKQLGSTYQQGMTSSLADAVSNAFIVPACNRASLERLAKEIENALR